MKAAVAIDIGTGSTRAALMTADGRTITVASREYGQIVPAFGWSEQRPSDWWDAAKAALSEVSEHARANGISIEAVCACGQMHRTVLVDANGRPARDAVPLWNDKRTLDYVRAFVAASKPRPPAQRPTIHQHSNRTRRWGQIRSRPVITRPT